MSLNTILCICQYDNDVMKGCKWEGEKLWMSCVCKDQIVLFAFFGCNKTWKHLERTRMKVLVLYYFKKHLCLSRPTNVQIEPNVKAKCVFCIVKFLYAFIVNYTIPKCDFHDYKNMNVAKSNLLFTPFL